MITKVNYEKILFHLFELERQGKYPLRGIARYSFYNCDCPIANHAPNYFNNEDYSFCDNYGNIHYDRTPPIKAYTPKDSKWWKSLYSSTKKGVLSKLKKDIIKYGDIDIDRYDTLISNLLTLEKHTGKPLKLEHTPIICPILSCTPDEDAEGNKIDYYGMGQLSFGGTIYEVYKLSDSSWWNRLSKEETDKYIYRMTLWLKYK
jgi:hypothetical protein